MRLAFLLLLLETSVHAAPVAERIAKAAAQLAGPAATAAVPAPLSGCAGLPESGPVAEPGAPVSEPAMPTPDRKFACPDGFRLDMLARLPACTRPGIKVVDGNPRLACYAAMALGPLAPLPPRHRPTHSCGRPSLTTVVRLSGANVGWGDATVTAVPGAGVTVTPLTATGTDVAEAENPVLQGCFAGDCRLLKLEIRADAAAVVELRVALPGGAVVGQHLSLIAECRDPSFKTVRDGTR